VGWQEGVEEGSDRVGWQEEVEEDGLFDLSTVTGWRQEMSRGNIAKETDKPTTSIVAPTSEITTTTKTTTSTTTSISTTTTTMMVTTTFPIQLTYRRQDERFLEPTFLFTTLRPAGGRGSKQMETTTLDHVDQTTLLVGQREEERSIPSHFFRLDDYPQDEAAEGKEVTEEDETVTEEEVTNSGDAAVRATWLYRVANSTGDQEVGSSMEEDSSMEEGLGRTGNLSEVNRLRFITASIYNNDCISIGYMDSNRERRLPPWSGPPGTTRTPWRGWTARTSGCRRSTAAGRTPAPSPLASPPSSSPSCSSCC
jgi:hypothetical protein